MPVAIASQRYSNSIDGLRGILVLGVVAFHYFHGSFRARSISANTLGLAYDEVLVFFGVSGLLVCVSFASKPLESSGARIRGFYSRRFLRILPLYWLSVAFLWYLHALTPTQVFIQATFLFGFWSYDRQHLPNPPTWSLFVEEVFYLFLPLVFPLLNRSRAIIALVVSCVVAVIFPTVAKRLGIPESNDFIGHSVPMQLPFLTMGIVFFFFKQRVEEIRWIALFDLLLLASLAGLIFTDAHSPFRFPWQLTLVMASLVTVLSSRSHFQMLFRFKPLCWVGLRCYFIYLWHVPMGEFLQPPTKSAVISLGLQGSLATLTAWMVATVVLLIASEISFRYIEGPLRRLGRKEPSSPSQSLAA